LILFFVPLPFWTEKKFLCHTATAPHTQTWGGLHWLYFYFLLSPSHRPLVLEMSSNIKVPVLDLFVFSILISHTTALKDFLRTFIPHQHHLISAADQESIFAANFISILSSELSSRISTPHIPSSFIACSPYRQLSQATQFFTNHQIPTELVSLSVENNQACYLFDSTIPQLDLLDTPTTSSSPSIPSWNVVIPYSDHLKIDPSVITFLTWLESKAEEPLESFPSSLNQDPHILHFEASPQDLYFSLLTFSPTASTPATRAADAAISPRQLTKNWITELNSNEIPCHLCAQYKSREISQNIPMTRVASSLDSFLKRHSSSSSSSSTSNHWDRWSRSWRVQKDRRHDEEGEGTEMEERRRKEDDNCQFASNQFHFRSHEIVFHIKSQQLHSFSCLSAFISTVITSSVIAKVAISFKIRTLNDFSRGIIQTGAPGEEVYSAHNLSGLNVIIGQADTGIDELSCYFIDPLHGQIPRSSLASPYTNYSYRKVIQYINYTSSGDVPRGHGTHTAGILSGSCAGGASSDEKIKYNGIAKDSKIAFFDLGASVSDGSYLETPDDVSEMITPASLAGATIHSDSWGGGYWYDSYCYEIDRYLYSHDDMVILFAAGNSGNYGTHTVLSPSIAKNAIAVGATGTGHTTQQKITIAAFFSSVGPTPDGRFVIPSRTF
jgi:hypothetical protein